MQEPARLRAACCQRVKEPQEIPFPSQLFSARSLGVIRAPTASWKPFGPLDFVLPGLRALRPCEPRRYYQDIILSLWWWDCVLVIFEGGCGDPGEPTWQKNGWTRSLLFELAVGAREAPRLLVFQISYFHILKGKWNAGARQVVAAEAAAVKELKEPAGGGSRERGHFFLPNYFTFLIHHGSSPRSYSSCWISGCSSWVLRGQSCAQFSAWCKYNLPMILEKKYFWRTIWYVMDRDEFDHI